MKRLLIMDSYNPRVLDAHFTTEDETHLLWLGMEFFREEWESDIAARGILRTGLSREQTWEFQKRFRDDYISFVADWPREPRYNGKNFIELFTHKGLSLWWLSETSEKNGFLHPTINYIFQLLVIREAVTLHNPRRAVVWVRDERFYRAITYLLRELGVEVESRGSGFEVKERGLPHYLFKRGTYLIRTIYTLPTCKRILDRITDRDLLRGIRPAVGFYSWFPATWIVEEGRAYERMYGKFPQLIEENGAYAPFYLAFLEISDPIFLGIVKRMAARRDDFKRIIPIQAFVGARDVVAAFLNIRHIARYLSLEYMRRHRESLRFRGIDVYHLIRTELRLSFLGPNIPRELISYLGIRNFLKRHGEMIRAFFYFLEFHRWERGLAAAFRGEGKIGRLVGLQHTTIPPMYTTYMFSPKEIDQTNKKDPDNVLSLPVPSRIILGGKKNLDYFIRSGFRREQIKILGSLRFDGRDIPVSDKRPWKRRVLLPTTSNPAISLSAVEMTIRACRQCGASLTVKPHPILDIGKEIVEKAEAMGFDSLEVSYRPIPDLLADADVVVTTWTTIALESLIYGRPVIAVCLLNAIDLSLFMGERDVPGLWNVFDRTELNQALTVIFKKRPEISQRERERLASQFLGEDPQFVYTRFFRLVADIERGGDYSSG